jgi:hypothetical protein
LGVPVDFVSTAKYFKLAAGQNEAVGQRDYGDCLFHGRSILIDFISAAKHYKHDADQNDAHAQFNCAYSLSEGLGVPIDLAAARSSENSPSGGKMPPLTLVSVNGNDRAMADRIPETSPLSNSQEHQTREV